MCVSEALSHAVTGGAIYFSLAQNKKAEAYASASKLISIFS